MSVSTRFVGGLTNIRTGKLDANAADSDGLYPFFTCSRQPLSINTYSYDGNAVLIAGNGDLNVKHYKGKFDAYQRTYIVESLDEQELDTRYLFWFMDKYVERLRELSIGGVIKYIKLGMLADAEISLPTQSEQKRIAAILDKADAIRRKRQQAIELADQFLRSVFLDLFGDPVTNPKGWDVTRLSNLADITTGNTPSRKVSKYYGEDIEWIKSDNINTSSHTLTRASEYLSALGEKVGRVVTSGSTLVTCIAGSPSCVGNCAFADRDVAFNQQINALTPKKDVEPMFLYALILFSKKKIQGANTNAMKGMVSKSKMSELQFISPPSILQRKFSEQFLRYKVLLAELNYQKAEAEVLSRSCSARAFAGEL